MLETMRKHHYVLMLIIAVIVIVSFSFFGYNKGHADGEEGSKRIYDRDYSSSDVRAILSEFRLAQGAGSFGDPVWRFAQTLMHTQGMDQRQGFETEALVTTVVIREEARKLGIAVEDEDLKKAVQALPRFQTEGKFDRSIYDAFMGSGGDKEAREREFFAMLKDALLLEKMRKLIGGSVPASEYQVTLAYNERNVKTTAKVFEFPKKEFESLKATDEEAQKFYDTAVEKYKALKDGDKEKEKAFAEIDPVLKSEETVDLSYVKLALADRTEEAKLKPDEQEPKKKEWKERDTKVRITASQLDIFVKDENKSLAEAAAILKEKPEYKDNPNYLPCEVKTVAGLTRENPPEDLKGEMALVDQMFIKDKETVQASKSYVTFVVDKRHEPRLLEFAEAKAKILEKKTKEKITAAVTDKANGVRAKIQEALVAGKPFEEAIKDVGVTPTELVWTPNRPPKDAPPYFSAVQTTARNLNAGSLATEAVPAGESLVLVYVDKKELPWDPDKGPLDKALLAKRLAIADSPNPYQYQPSPLFSTWLQQRREAADPVLTPAQ